MPTIAVKDATGNSVQIQQPSAPGRASESASKPVALSTEDLAALQSRLSEAGFSTLTNQLLTALAAVLKDATFTARIPEPGAKAAANSVPVALATENTNALAALLKGTDFAAGNSQVLTALGALLTGTTFTDRVPTLGTKAASGSLSVTPSNDQDPILDHVNGVKAIATTASATVFTPPAGCKYARVNPTADVFLRTDGQPAADDGKSILVYAGQLEPIPVVAGVAVTAITATGTSTVRITPMKTR